ncbi:BRD4-interacting chromatin-remodeling complex-associated protein isoform X2 [Gouania willdenowi]|uniref:BRD4-interacting chromatin-remodeling complex-associated protein isoform X2 n=1 Tax=Gouania willdenowi TaxID=441366 RepID=UPI001054D986|nr:BRD4-interacting chromatin-remodeling complex-associated protein-like isoform X2 [Gouania willdenowi]
MEDEDGTCLLDVLCDPQALNDFLHGTNELQTEDLLINASSGEPSLFTDAPSPVSLLGDGRDSPDTPPSGCVDLSFLEEALLSSPEGEEDLQVVQGGPPVDAECEAKKGEVEEEEAEVECDILQQSLQEAEITEQTMALEAGLAPPGDTLSLYSPAPTAPFITKAMTLPRDTQAAVEPPQPSLLAVGPGCPSLKPAAAPAHLMGILPGNVFPAPSPETSFSLSHTQRSSMIIHKAVPNITSRPILTPTLRATAAAPGIVLQRAPLPIQPKLPISIQPRLVQISPKPTGQKPTPGLTFVHGTASSNILLSQAPVQKSVAPSVQCSQQLPKPVSLQLLNQSGSFVLQPQGLFSGQNQFLLPGQSPVTIPQTGNTAHPLLTPGHHQGPALHSVTSSAGQIVDGSQILTMPQRQLNFSPVFTTPTGQLALRQTTVLSGPLQLQSAPTAVFQMPAQLAGAYTAGGQGQRATLVHSPALGNHITLINSSGVLPSDLTSISIVNGPSVVQGLPLQTGVGEAQLSLQPTSVVLLPERTTVGEERSTSEENYQHLQQPLGHILQHVSMQPTSAGLQSSSPPVVTVLQPPAEPPPVPDPALEMSKLLIPIADSTQPVEEVSHSVSQNQAFMSNLQQPALSSPISSELLVETLPVVPMEPLSSPVSADRETHPPPNPPGPSQDSRAVMSEQIVEVSSEETPLQNQDSRRPPSTTFSPPAGSQTDSSVPQMEATAKLPTQPLAQPPTQPPAPPHLQPSQTAFSQPQAHIQSPASHSQVQMQLPVSQPQLLVRSTTIPPPPLPPPPLPQHVSVSVPDSTAAVAPVSKGRDHPAVTQHTQHKPKAAFVGEGKTFSLDVHPPSSTTTITTSFGVQVDTSPANIQINQQSSTKGALCVPLEPQRDETLTPAVRRHSLSSRFQQQLYSDRGTVQTSFTGPAFFTLKDAVRRLLPYHSCAGYLPTQEDFSLVDQEFDTVSGFLLKRTKDMVNKYRQLLFRETQESPSAEMVMLERLFLQAERYALAEDRRRVRRDPESFMASFATSSSSPGPSHSSASSHSGPHSSPSSPPPWARLSDRPPGLKTYRSSNRGGLRLTIKQESGSRKVVHNSACDLVLKRDHKGQLTNGGGAPQLQYPEHKEEISNGDLHSPPTKEVHTIPSHNPLPMSEQQDAALELLPRDVSAPKLKCYRLDEQRFSPPPPPLQEDMVLSEHLQSAIDSILELQRLQGPALDQTVTSILQGHL